MAEQAYEGVQPVVCIRISLQVHFPGMATPVFLEGMQLSVDGYVYHRYKELGELDRWLHWQATDYVMKNSRVRHVAISAQNGP